MQAPKVQRQVFFSRLTRNVVLHCAIPQGTLFHLFETRGIHCWRDMTQDDVTEQGMKKGVKNSDVFLLFLTNSMLSRP